MTNMQDKIVHFDYKGGRDVTDKLKLAMNYDSFEDLARAFDIPKSTIFTWHKRNMTPFEIAVRVHLAKGVSLRWLLLDEGEPFDAVSTVSDKKLTIEKITNGVLDESGEMTLDLATMERYDLTPSNTRVIDLDGTLLFINTEETKPISGRYLLDIDGAMSVNHLQRLPGKKIAISYGNTPIEVAEDDIAVLGRVALVMEKE